MLTIKIGNRKIKLLNWLIFISVICLIVYVVGSVIFILPMFNSKYEYKINKTNYKIAATTKFKHAWFKCNIKEEYNVSSSDKLILKTIKKDLIDDGFKYHNNKFIRYYKKSGFCSDDKKEYIKVHDDNYSLFNLIESDNVTLKYGDTYTDSYVDRKVGKYIISYSIKLSNEYKQRLYRIINVVDDEKPVIELTGDKEINLDYASRYVEPGFDATDNYDGNITNKVKINNKVNTKKAGRYEISYSVCDTNNNCIKEKRVVNVKEKTEEVVVHEPVIEEKNGITYVDGILLVNKKYGLPKNYDPGVNKEALEMVKLMQKDAEVLGLNLPIVSSYRSYKTQEKLHATYAKKDGEEKASTYSALAGHSEHQTGLAFDLGSTDSSFANTNEAKWLKENAHLYGFIIRYPKDKTNITGYIYEPWHVRYLGKDVAKKVWQSGLTLEEYLGVE